jgi:hypothetical protein
MRGAKGGRLHSIRVDRGFRALFLVEGARHVLLWAGSHEETIRWVHDNQVQSQASVTAAAPRKPKGWAAPRKKR